MSRLRLTPGLYAVLLAVTALALSYTDALWRADRWLYDWSTGMIGRPVAQDIVVVAIDESSLAALGRWPWPRRVHATLVEQLTAAGAKAIALDIIIADPDLHDAEGDGLLASAVAASGRVVLPVTFERDPASGRLQETLPLPALAHAAAALGHVDVEHDPDGVVRSVYLTAGLGSPHWPSLSLALWGVAESAVPEALPGTRHPQPQTASPDVWVRDHHILLPDLGGAGSYARVSYIDVLRGAVPAERLRDRYVLVGMVVEGLADKIIAPGLGRNQPKSGVEFNAGILDSLRRGDLIEPLTLPWAIALTLILVLPAAVLYPRVASRWAPTVPGVMGCAALALSVGLLQWRHLWYAPASALLTLALSYPLWIWRELEQALGYLQRELQRLRGEAPPPASMSAALDSMARFLMQLIPATGIAVQDAAGKMVIQQGASPTTAANEVTPGEWLVQGEVHWLARPSGWRLGIAGAGNGAPDDAQRALLSEYLARCEEAAAPRAAPQNTLALVQNRVREVEAETTQLRAMQDVVNASLGRMGAGVVIASRFGQVVFANARAAAYLQRHSPESMRDESLVSLLAPLRSDHGGGWVAAVSKALLRGETVQFTAWLGDHVLWVQVIPGEDDGRGAAGVIISLADITLVHTAAQRATEQAVLEERERAVMTLRALDEAVITADAAGVVEYMNPRAVALVGVSLEQARGRSLSEVVMLTEEEGGRPLLLNAADLCVAGQGLVLGRAPVLHSRSGEEWPVLASLAPIFGTGQQRTGTVLTMSDISELRNIARTMAHQASHDALTGLPNQALLRDRAQHAIRKAARNGKCLAILFIDLDRFKHVNDALGHAVGNALLCDMAVRLVQDARSCDTVARLGGDEFIVLLDEIPSEQQVTVVARKLLASMTRPCVVDGHELWVTGSIGISVYPRDGEDWGALLKNADLAMYRAKEDGGNNFAYYAEEMNARSHTRLSMERNLHHALEKGEFELHYQPQIDIATGAVAGLEALIRWRTADGVYIPPDQFVPLAEETGMINSLGVWSLRTACEDIKTWLAQGYVVPRVSVNLSMRQFRQGDIAEMIAEVLAVSGLDGCHLALEMTESMMMHDPNRVEAVLRTFKGLGIEVSIDDFGMGHSSLSRLKRFPIDEIKIDRSFVHGIGVSLDDEAIVSAVIAMTHSMGKRVVAEGVETAGQLEFLRAKNCDRAQGYYFAFPQSSDRMTAFLGLNKTAGVDASRALYER